MRRDTRRSMSPARAALYDDVFGNRRSFFRLGKITESDLSLSDVTTWNFSITRHGFVPKGLNDPVYYLDSTGGWSVPVTGGTVIGAALGTIMAVRMDLWGS